MKKFIKNTIAILSSAERKRLLTFMLLDILISVVDIIFLAFLLLIIQVYTQPSAARPSFLPSWLTNSNSLMPVISFVALFSIKNLFGFLIYRSQTEFLCKVSSRLSKDMLMEYLDGPFSNYVNVDSSIHIRKINHQPIEFSHHILGGIQQIVTQFALITFSVAAIVLYKAKIFLLLLAILLPPVVIVFFMVKRKLRSAKTHMKKSSDRSLQYLQESLAGFVESNVYNRNQFFVDRYATYQKKFAGYHADLLVAQGIPSRAIEIFALVGLFILIAFSRWTGNVEGATIITIGAFMAAAYKIIPGIVKILNINSEIQTYSHVVNELLQNERRDKPADKADTKIIQSIQLKNISFKFENEFLLNNFNLSINSGDFLGISGLSGKGKTTILNLLLGFLRPEAGDIIINGHIARNGTLQQYWRDISYVKQQTFLIHDTVGRNITMTHDSGDGRKLQEIIHVTGLAEFVESLREGINNVITESGKNISGGQRQRIAIARSLYKNGTLIILDEPFNELDEQSANCLLTHFQRLTEKGKMVILITHDKKALSFCNKIISLDEQH